MVQFFLVEAICFTTSSLKSKKAPIMCIIDAFVCAHNRHRRNLDNPGNFGGCMEGRIRLMAAITPTYAHAYQSICLVGRPILIPLGKARCVQMAECQ